MILMNMTLIFMNRCVYLSKINQDVLYFCEKRFEEQHLMDFLSLSRRSFSFFSSVSDQMNFILKSEAEKKE